MNVTSPRSWWWSVGLVLIVLGVVALVFLLVFPGLTAETNYVYDDAGRLRTVIDSASDRAIYVDVAVGSLTSIRLQPFSTLSVLQCFSSAIPIGSNRTLYGTGFSAIPSSNALKFNGTTATVLVTSATALTTTVPNGGTTGLVSVAQL